MTRTLLLSAVLTAACSLPARAGLIVNGGFEAGLTGWTAVTQVGSEGSFLLQNGGQTPLTLGAVPAPPGGANAAMTDAFGPGSRLLYQDFIVPTTLPGAVVNFSLYINNAAPDFFVPPHLDFASTAPDPLLRLNQQARVDITLASADPFTTDPSEVLQTLYVTASGDPLISGYSNYEVDVATLLRSRPGETLRLRFAQVDNVLTFNLGVDNVDVNVVPEPSTWVMTIGALVGLAFTRRRKA